MLGNTCHAPIPGPTRLADPNRVRGARLYTGTLYRFFLFIYLFFYNRIKISETYTKELPLEWCPSKSIHIYILSPIYIYKNCTFTFTNQSAEPTCSEPLLVC